MKKSSYSAPITRNNPALIGFVLDMSGSMSEEVVYEGVTVTKSEALNTIVNRTIYELVCRCKKFSGCCDYFDFFAIGYADDKIVNLFEDTIGESDKDGWFYRVSDLAGANVEKKRKNRVFRDVRGNERTASYTVPQYINPSASGRTPMYRALQKTHELTRIWIEDMSGNYNYPPIVVHITDGDTTDASIDDVIGMARRIRTLETEDGNTLLLNIHISSCDDTKTYKYPSSTEDLPDVKNASDLFEMSSSFPESMLFYVKKSKDATDLSEVVSSRMMTYNADIATVLEAMNIGTISLTRNI